MIQLLTISRVTIHTKKITAPDRKVLTKLIGDHFGFGLVSYTFLAITFYRRVSTFTF